MTVILGAIEMRKRTRLEGLMVYLGSLRWQNPDIRLVLFNRSPEHEALTSLLRRYDVESVNAEEFDALHQIPAVEIEIARFLEYRAWLFQHRVSSAILTDVLDVVWQGDPERLTLTNSMLAYQENQIIGECPYNSKWMREVFPDQHTAWMTRPIVCCGVIVGGYDPLTHYLGWYAEVFAARGADHVRRGFDSAIVNGYAATHAFGLLVLPFQNGGCMHLGYADPATVTYDGAVQCGGYAPTVAHQYNRHPEVTRGLYQRWI